VLSLGGRLGGQPRWVTAAMVESLDAEGSTRDGASTDDRRHRQVMAVEGTSDGSGAPWGGGGGAVRGGVQITGCGRIRSGWRLDGRPQRVTTVEGTTCQSSKSKKWLIKSKNDRVTVAYDKILKMADKNLNND
jgi:hypothetical protein